MSQSEKHRIWYHACWLTFILSCLTVTPGFCYVMSKCLLWKQVFTFSLVLFLDSLHLDPRLPEASGSEPRRQDELRRGQAAAADDQHWLEWALRPLPIQGQGHVSFSAQCDIVYNSVWAEFWVWGEAQRCRGGDISVSCGCITQALESWVCVQLPSQRQANPPPPHTSCSSLSYLPHNKSTASYFFIVGDYCLPCPSALYYSWVVCLHVPSSCNF